MKFNVTTTSQDLVTLIGSTNIAKVYEAFPQNGIITFKLLNNSSETIYIENLDEDATTTDSYPVSAGESEVFSVKSDKVSRVRLIASGTAEARLLNA